jgi:DNA-binding FadR family transcriptional regulator
MPVPHHGSRFVSIAEVAATLGVSERSVRERIHHLDPVTRRPLIPHQRFGRRVLIPRVWLDQFVESAELEAQP